MGELTRKYKDHPQVDQAILRINNGSPILAGTNTPYERYKQQIGQYDLLEAEDEVRLFRVIENGLNLYREQGITPENEQALIDLIIARQIVYVSNLRLVIEHAVKLSIATGGRMPLSDLTQEGNIGIANAIDRFDYQQGFKFSTYATWHVRQVMQRAVGDKSRTIRIPVHLHDRLVQLGRTTTKLRAKLDREPKTHELAEAMELSLEDIVKLQRANRIQPTSLNSPAPGGESDRESGDIIPDPVDEIERKSDDLDNKTFINQIFATPGLKQREKYILSFRLGFEVDDLIGTQLELSDSRIIEYKDILAQIYSGEASLTLDEAGQMFGVTRERIRQIEAKGLKRIKEAYVARASGIKYMPEEEFLVSDDWEFEVAEK